MFNTTVCSFSTDSFKALSIFYNSCRNENHIFIRKALEHYKIFKISITAHKSFKMPKTAVTQ